MTCSGHSPHAVGMDKIHPLLAAVAAGGTVKEVICARISLVEQGNEVVLHGSLLGHIEAELPVHGLELVACFIHAFILLQFCLSVKGVMGDFFRIHLVGLGSAQGIILKALMRIGFTALTKIPASESHVATGS